MATNNPFLEKVGSTEGAKHQIKRLVNSELQTLTHVHDTDFVVRRLRAVGVNTVGSDETLLKFWMDQVKQQMEATHGTKKKPAAKPKQKNGLAKRLARSVGFATHVLL